VRRRDPERAKLAAAHKLDAARKIIEIKRNRSGNQVVDRGAEPRYGPCFASCRSASGTTMPKDAWRCRTGRGVGDLSLVVLEPGHELGDGLGRTSGLISSMLEPVIKLEKSSNVHACRADCGTDCRRPPAAGRAKQHREAIRAEFLHLHRTDDASRARLVVNDHALLPALSR